MFANAAFVVFGALRVDLKQVLMYFFFADAEQLMLLCPVRLLLVRSNCNAPQLYKPISV